MRVKSCLRVRRGRVNHVRVLEVGESNHVRGLEVGESKHVRGLEGEGQIMLEG